MGVLDDLFGGGSSDAEEEAKKARKAEEARQKRIGQGTKAINDFFDTGVGVWGDVDKPKAGKTYYDVKGKRIKTPSATSSGGGSGGGNSTRRLVNGKTYDPGQVKYVNGQGWVPDRGAVGTPYSRDSGGDPSGPDLFSDRIKGTAFDDDFFSGLEKDYLGYAKPQLDRQYNTAGEDLTYFLADRGLLDSSTRGNKTSELKKTYETERQGLKETGKGYATQARGDVENARGDLISMLTATGDTDAVSASALSRADALSKTPAYSPLSNLFADFTAGLGTQAQLERGAAYGGPQPRYNTGLFNPRPGAVRNT